MNEDLKRMLDTLYEKYYNACFLSEQYKSEANDIQKEIENLKKLNGLK